MSAWGTVTKFSESGVKLQVKLINHANDFFLEKKIKTNINFFHNLISGNDAM